MFSARSGSRRRIVCRTQLLSSRALGSGLAPTLSFILPLVFVPCRFAVGAVLLVLGVSRLIPLLATAVQGDASAGMTMPRPAIAP